MQSSHNAVGKRQVSLNIAYNIAATAIPILVLQMILLPLISRRMQDEAGYGLILTLIGIINLLASIGGALNNSRLLLNQQYERNGLRGDYNMLLAIGSIACFTAAIGISTFYLGGFSLHSVLVGAIAALSVLHSYGTVAFRLSINYKRILANNVVQATGYFVGYLIYMATDCWEAVLLTGYAAGLLYVLAQSSVMREPLAATPLFWHTTANVGMLCLSFLLANAFTYVDRLLLYPHLGGAAVAIYYVSTLFGKVVSMGISPVSGVMLSYLVRMTNIQKNTLWLLLGGAIASGVVGYFACLLGSPWLLGVLYPDTAQQALAFIQINTATAMLAMVCGFLNPVVMKFRNVLWQVALPAISLIFYAGLSLPLMNQYGLLGFCWGVLLANVVKTVLMVILVNAGASRPCAQKKQV